MTDCARAKSRLESCAKFALDRYHLHFYYSSFRPTEELPTSHGSTVAFQLLLYHCFEVRQSEPGLRLGKLPKPLLRVRQFIAYPFAAQSAHLEHRHV